MKSIIIVEGRHDVARIHEARPDLEAVAIGGSALDEDVIKRLSSRKDAVFYLFLDPDSPGERIRGRLHEAFPQARDLFVPKDEARSSNKRKVGVEHVRLAKLSAILSSLPPEDRKGTLSASDLMALGLTGTNDSRAAREAIGRRYNIGTTNARTFLARLNALGITREQLEKHDENA